MQALLLAAVPRVFSLATFGMELVVPVASNEKRPSHLPCRCETILTRKALPRIVMMYELDIHPRLSALALLRAIGSWRRACADPNYWQEKKILQCAMQEPPTWAAAVISMEMFA